MADTFTALLHMTLPEIGASDDTWGDKLNDNFDILDALFGTTGQGTVIVRDVNNDALVSGINLTKAAGNARVLKINSGASKRWDFGADATAEAGANAGSLFKINRYDDAGILLGTPFQIDRASGLVTFASTPKVGANDVLHQGNLSNIAVPIGTPIPWLLDTLPSSGYLWMNGSTFVRADFPLLFALIGTTFGVGNGTTTAGLPDWREVVPVGKSTMGGVGARGIISHLTLTNIAAAPVGEAKHALAATEHAAHSHAVFLNDPGHIHGVTQNANAANSGASVAAGGNPGIVTNGGASISINSNVTGITVRDTAGGGGTANVTAASGNGDAHNNVQPSTVCNWAVKAAA